MNNILFYKLHLAGLFNRLLSLELAIGLAHCSKKDLVIYNITGRDGLMLDNPSISSNVDLGKRNLIIDKEMVDFFSLIDYTGNVNIRKADFYEIETFVKDEQKINEYLQDMYYVVNENDSVESFSLGRKRLDLSKGPVHLSGYNICYYSSFFFNRNISLDQELSKIKFKKEYWDFANMVADSIGEFNGAHIRLTDHKYNFEVTQDMFDEKINFLNDRPIFILTDDVTNPMFKNKNIILLDDYIVDNFSKEFLSLSSQSEAVFGLVSAMIMSRSSKFIGTFLSTFTGFIQRERAKNDKDDFVFFGKETLDKGTPFSWNTDNVTFGIGLSRDWPESRLMV